MKKIAAIQMTSGPDKDKNLEAAFRLIRRACDEGADLIGLPETFSWMGPDEGRAEAAETLEGPTLRELARLARELGVHLLCGSIVERGGPEGRFHNTSVLLGPDGRRIAAYRKIHLFDVEIGDGATYLESKQIAPGTEVVAADCPGLGTVGLSVCYDLRFPELYRALASRGASLIAVPSAFTLLTGKDHWEVLLRARAIENQAYVLAPAQQGNHPGGRTTFGQAMVVDPWGLVIARCPDGEGIALAPFEPERIEQVRARLPALSHRRL